jgi:hypothetical protein
MNEMTIYLDAQKECNKIRAKNGLRPLDYDEYVMWAFGDDKHLSEMGIW